MGPPSSDAEPTLRGHAAGSRVFGRYTLVEILGRGGMGVVWRARDETLGEEVALKFLPDAVRWDPGAFDDLKEETRRARQITHPNIVRIHDFVEDATGAAISMELVEGETLTALRLRRPGKIMEPADILPWLPQLCAALDFAHREARVVHRDLKPTNLMLTREGRLKVTDFGVARSMADSISRVSMMAAGTLVYMSPQQAMGEDPTPADDLYAVGATLYELMTGKPPFHTGDVRVQLFQRRPDAIAVRRRALGQVGKAVPPEWEATLAACLAKEPEARPASAGELGRRLQPDAAATRQRRRRRPTRREFALTSLAVVIAGAGLWWRGRASLGAAEVRAPTFPSDATRAFAAWNFDGDARDASGRGFHGEGVAVVPTTDRFGRIDRALKFNGQAGITVSDSPMLRWGGGSPFTAAIWVRNDESPTLNGDIWTVESSTVGAFEWMLGFAHGRPQARVSRVHSVPDHCIVEAEGTLAPGTWHHLAMASDGATLTLYVDGKAAGSRALGVMRGVGASETVVYRFGRPGLLSSWAFDGALDDARLWRRALSDGELATLAKNQAPPRIGLTRGMYSDKEDLAVAIREEYGAEARLLDWNEIAHWHAHDTLSLAERVGFAPAREMAWVQRNGERWFDSTRHYFISRFDGRKPEYFKVHDEIGGLTLALGSWFGSRVPAFALRPPSRVRTEVLVRAGAESRLRREGKIGEGSEALQLSWRVRLSPVAGAMVAAQLRSGNGREVRAVAEIAADKRLAVALGAAEGGGISRMAAVGYGESDCTLVARDGRLSFRLISAVGGVPQFMETATVDGFRLEDVVEIAVAAAGGAEVHRATVTIE